MKNDNCLPSIYQGQPTPIVGFILQKDVYTTNLLYANDQFSTKSLRKRLPFRTGSGRKPNNPSSSLTILRQNGYMSENSENEDLFYMRNTFRPKKLRNKHLKFPLPKIKPVPLTNAILREDICKQDVRIKYMEDDLNITSKFGKKIFYNLKENNRPYETNFPINNNLKLMKDKEVGKKSSLNTMYGPRIRKFPSEFKFSKLTFKKYNRFKYKFHKNSQNLVPVRQAIYQINSELKLIELEDKERKKLFCRSDFFPTQLQTLSNNETSSNKTKIIMNI